jgi:H+/Cl- antiporter ClcA
MQVLPRKVKLLSRRWYRSQLAVIIESILIGFAAGFVVVLFRLSLTYADRLRGRIYGALRELPWYWLLLWAGVLVLTGLFLGWAAKVRPMVKGSGIPQVRGALMREMTMDWGPELPLKLVTGILGLGAGLSLGREGPSILIGAYAGMGILTLFRRPHAERKYLITAASAAGLSAAFNAPLAGILFVLEELGSSFTPLFIACAMGASVAADAVAGYFFGLRPVFDFHELEALSLDVFPWVALLGAACALLGDLFKRSLYAGLNLYDRLKIPTGFRPVIPLLVSIPVCLFCADIAGGGHSLIESLSVEERGLAATAILLTGKLLFTALCYGSGTSGGIFLPLLACGALTGSGLGILLSTTGLLPEGQHLTFMILGMAAFFSAVVKAPVTGVILILEMSGNFEHLGSLVLVCLSAFVTAELIASRPVYAVLMERMLAAKKKPE